MLYGEVFAPDIDPDCDPECEEYGECSPNKEGKTFINDIKILLNQFIYFSMDIISYYSRGSHFYHSRSLQTLITNIGFVCQLVVNSHGPLKIWTSQLDLGLRLGG